jgi:hypothetical protein
MIDSPHCGGESLIVGAFAKKRGLEGTATLLRNEIRAPFCSSAFRRFIHNPPPKGGTTEQNGCTRCFHLLQHIELTSSQQFTPHAGSTSPTFLLIWLKCVEAGRR